ncbi:MAG TPA: hypothetical protein PLP89_00675 [Synergistales bacterium]|jgi:hypothetical protein|nr:hypothetical protein [Synergistales bacterium]HRV71515.1 hypothetical protein [Thermovirgaceae bacterium]
MDKKVVFVALAIRLGLESEGIPFISADAEPDRGGLDLVKVIFPSRQGLADLDGFLKGNFIVRESEVNERPLRARMDPPPARYLVFPGPERMVLPEWKSFADAPVTVEAITLFMDALDRSLGLLPLPPDRKFLDEMVSMAGALEERRLDIRPAEDLGSQCEEAEGRLSSDDLALFFRTSPGITGRWFSAAAESGVNIQGAVTPLGQESDTPGFTALLKYLRRRKVADIHGLSTLTEERLGSWDLLYQALEISRVRGIMTSASPTVFEFAHALFLASEAHE